VKINEPPTLGEASANAQRLVREERQEKKEKLSQMI